MRFGDTIYWAKVIRDEDGYITGWEKPIEITLEPNYFSLQPTRGYSEIVVFGQDIQKFYTAYAPYDVWGESFNEDDKFYVDYVKPEDEEEDGDKANARCRIVLYDNLFIKLIIEKLVVQNGN